MRDKRKSLSNTIIKEKFKDAGSFKAQKMALKRRADSHLDKNFELDLIEEELSIAEISEKLKNILF